MCGHVFCVNLKLLNSAKKKNAYNNDAKNEKREREREIFKFFSSCAQCCKSHCAIHLYRMINELSQVVSFLVKWRDKYACLIDKARFKFD